MCKTLAQPHLVCGDQVANAFCRKRALVSKPADGLGSSKSAPQIQPEHPLWQFRLMEGDFDSDPSQKNVPTTRRREWVCKKMNG